MKNARKTAMVLPDIVKDEWCDIRKDYESGLSVLALSEKYICDPRTIRNCLKFNISSDAIGSRHKPKLIDGYERQIEKICKDRDYKSVLSLSQSVTEELREQGFTGGERTVRNYLMKQPYLMAKLEDRK